MNQPVPNPAPGAGRSAAHPPLLGRVPLAVWVILGVAAAHVLFFWVVADKHFLPEAPHVPAAPPVNFAAREQTSLDPVTGETVTEQQFVISRHVATPTPSPRPSAAPLP